MDDFENLAGFLEHISLVMDTDEQRRRERVSIMTLHAAKGLEFDTVFLPGWEEGLFPHQRSLDESGRAGLEEERRLAYVGLTRARRRAKIWFASNRRIHGLWQSTIPSRFVDELPEAHVEVVQDRPPRYGRRHVRHEPLRPRAALRGVELCDAGLAARPGQHGRRLQGEHRAPARSPPRSRASWWRNRPARVSAYKVGDRVFHIEVRLWRRGRGRRQQAHRGFRQGRPQARRRLLRRTG